MYMIKNQLLRFARLCLQLSPCALISHLFAADEKDAVILRVIELNSLACWYMLAPYQNITQLDCGSLKNPSERSKYLNVGKAVRDKGVILTKLRFGNLPFVYSVILSASPHQFRPSIIHLFP
jgi:hypothetical protein